VHKFGWVVLLWLNTAIIVAVVVLFKPALQPRVVIQRSDSTVLGEIIHISFNQPVDRTAVLASLRIEPEFSFQTMWDDESRRLDLLPAGGLLSEASYRITIGEVRPLWVPPLVAQASAIVHLGSTRAEVGIGSLPSIFVDTKPGGLPSSEDAYVLHGERVDASQPRYTEGTYIDIDLTREILTVFTDGQVRNMFEVSAQGPPYHPTPSGEFAIQSKSPNHFSSLSHVWMPWSLHFHGDYFIHEVPYYPNGTLVTTRYSGGCIRLDEGVAEEVYNIAERGMKLVIHRS